MAEPMTDADAFADEVDGAPVPFAWKGHEYELPAGLPALVVVKASRIARKVDGDQEVPTEDVLEMIEAIFGEELLDRVLGDTRTTAEELGDLLQAAMAAYQVTAPGNREARRAAARGGRGSTSGGRGQGSRRISGASTGSGSRPS